MSYLFYHGHYSNPNCFMARMVVYFVVIFVDHRFRVSDIFKYGFIVVEQIFMSPDGNPKHFNLILRSDTKSLPIRNTTISETKVLYSTVF